MVARTPPKLRKMVAPLNPTLLRETLDKVDKCMARLQELQYTVSGGTKVISGVSLSPRSTRGYLRTSLRCKQESLRIKNSNPRKSSPGKLPTTTGEWRRMSLPAMLVGETVGEILQATQFARDIVAAVSSKTNKPTLPSDPKTPINFRRKNQRPANPEASEIRARRKREKQVTSRSTRSSISPSLQRAKSRINFVSSPLHRREIDKENFSENRVNRVSPRNRPWGRKTVLFPNPLFHSSPTSKTQQFCKTKSPIIGRNNRLATPHKFMIKARSPPRTKKSPVSILSSLSPARPASRKSPKESVAGKLRRSFSPSRLASRLVSPLKSRKLVQRSDAGGGMAMSGLKQRPISTPVRFSVRRI